MKRRNVILTATVLFSTMLILMGCGGSSSTGDAGAADLLAMLPADASGVVTLNFNELVKTNLYEKILEQSKTAKKDDNVDQKGGFDDYQEFMEKSGIDPRKDVHMAAVAFLGSFMPGSSGGASVFVVKGNFNKDKLIQFAKESQKNEGGEAVESTHNGLTMFTLKSAKTGKDFSFSVLNDSIITGGDTDGIKKVIDVSKGAANLLTNTKLKSHLEKLKGGSVFTVTAAFPDEFKKVHDGGMFKFDTSKAEAITAYVGYTGSAWELSLTLVSHNEEGNTELVSTLNGLKSMGAMGGQEIGELTNNIELFSSAHDVTLKVTISDTLIEQLEKKFASGFMGMGMGGQQ